MCRKQYSALVGTIFEGTHLPLSTWLVAIHMMCAGKNGVSAHELHRQLGITLKSAWFMAHRIRFAMQRPPLVDKATKRRVDKPVSLAPLDFKEALTNLLAVEPEEGEPEEIDRSAPKSDEES